MVWGLGISTPGRAVVQLSFIYGSDITPAHPENPTTLRKQKRPKGQQLKIKRPKTENNAAKN